MRPRLDRQCHPWVAANVAELAMVGQVRRDDLVAVEPDPDDRDLGTAVRFERDQMGQAGALEDFPGRIRDACHRLATYLITAVYSPRCRQIERGAGALRARQPLPRRVRCYAASCSSARLSRRWKRRNARAVMYSIARLAMRARPARWASGVSVRRVPPPGVDVNSQCPSTGGPSTTRM